MKPLLKRAFKKLPKPAQEASKKALRSLSPPYARTRLSAGVQPLSFHWGADRGQEIARYYIEKLFLKEFTKDIRGRVLEFFADDYTSKFGDKKAIKKIDVLNLEEGNPHTTILGDLTKPNDIPSNAFDCIICTHVLHVIYEFDKAIADMYRVLRSGGVLLIAVPHVSMCDPGWGELWRFTEQGLHDALARAFDKKNITMRSYGNSLTAAGQIRGLAAHEFTKKELHFHDKRFAVDICARAVK
jgi:SAM-dependent methyltransferase